MKIHIPAGPVLAPTDKKAHWLKGRAPIYEVVGDYDVWVNGELYRVESGYLTNLASIPSPLWWLWPPGYAPASWAATWHDKAYSHWYKWMDKRFADEVFYQIMLYRGANKAVAKMFKLAVSTFGRGGWK